jgi:polyisoprenoid-binding protein YceI
MRRLYLLAILLSSVQICDAQIYRATEGRIHFVSDAPLELIEAESDKLDGAMRNEDHTFAFTVPISSFNGFNSALQREHFLENYLESDKMPNAKFTGKIIEKINLTKAGSYDVRVKGELTIHGITKERIIRSALETDGVNIDISSTFEVELDDHDIRIPRIVYQKIAESITVTVSAKLSQID